MRCSSAPADARAMYRRAVRTTQASVRLRTPPQRGWRWSLKCAGWAMWIIGVAAFLYYGFPMPSNYGLAVVALIFVGVCADGAAHPRARRATWVVCAILGLGWAFVGAIGVGLGVGLGLGLAGGGVSIGWPISVGLMLTNVPIFLTLAPRDVAASK